MPKNVDILFSFDPEKVEARQPPHAGLRAKLIIPDPELIGKKATFTIKRHVQVKDSRPVHDTEEMFKHKFTVRGGKVTVPIPHHVLEDHPFQYDGEQIEIKCFGELVINDKLIRKDTSVQKDLPMEALKKPVVNSNTDELIEPKDIFSFSKNLMAIPTHNKIATLGLLVVGLVVIVVNMLIGVHDQFSPEHATYFYSHFDSDGDGSSPLVKALGGCGTIGAAIWFAIRRQLRKYMTFKFKPITGSINRQSEHAVSDLFYGVSRADLKDVTLRIVACNMEKGKYVRGSGSNQRTVSFSTPVRGVLLYSKKVTLIPKNQPVENYFRDSMSFEPMFKALYPPSEVSESHGLFIYWEVQLIHNDFVDQELAGDTVHFRREDFFTA
jgi:hypothetical protein